MIEAGTLVDGVTTLLAGAHAPVDRTPALFEEGAILSSASRHESRAPSICSLARRLRMHLGRICALRFRYVVPQTSMNHLKYISSAVKAEEGEDSEL